MLNLAGSRFDFDRVLFAVLEECEHRRRGLTGARATEELREIAVAKLEELGLAYRQADGSAGYWAALRAEVVGTALPQYLPEAVRHSELECSRYGVWREGDLLARAVFALAGLTVGGIIIALPFIPIFEDAFAFALALGGWLYPELRKLMFDRRHRKLLNALLASAQRYQQTQLRSLSDADLDEVLAAPLPDERTTRGGAAARSALPTRGTAS